MSSGWGGEDVVYPLGERQGGCKVRGPHSVTRSPGTLLTDSWRFPGCRLPQMVRVFLPPTTLHPLLFIALQRGKKGNFSRFENKQGQSTEQEQAGVKEAVQEHLNPRIRTKWKNSGVCLLYPRPADNKWKKCTSKEHLTFPW